MFMKRMLCVFSVVFIVAIAIMMQFAGLESPKNSYIKYVEFNVTKSALQSAIDLDIATHEEDNKADYITLLAYLGAKYKYVDMTEFADKIKYGQSV